MITVNEKRELFLNALIQTGKNVVTKKELKQIISPFKISPDFYIKNPDNRAGHALYKVPNFKPSAAPVQSPTLTAQVLPISKPIEKKKSNTIANVITDLETGNLVPQKYSNYVPFGNFDSILSIIESKMFFPVFITGQSGNGKTLSIEQACAKAKRKYVCVSMTPETDEGDLLGNYVLIDGQMVWRDGPVTLAARQGAVLCIDEIDYGGSNLSALQRVLEGKPFLLKKKNELITPADGFTVFATANTKGKGSEDGRFMFTNVLNEAFLERFVNTFEQDWPPVKVEKSILTKELSSININDKDFAEKLVTWADVIRKTFADDGCDEVISTRRLVHIVKTFGIFKDKLKSVEFCLNRFDADTKATFLDLYTKVDSGANTKSLMVKTESVEVDEEN